MPDPNPTSAPTTPAYAAAPRRSGLLYAIAGIVALAAVAALAIFMLGGRSPAPLVVTPESRGDGPKSPDAAKATLDAASKSVLNPAPETSPVAAPPPAVVAESTASAAPPKTAPRTEAPPPAQRPAAAPKTSSPPTATAPAPVAPPSPATPPVQVASADVWTQMREELSRCSSSSVIPRIQCERRIRARYCDGHWGTVPDCPTTNRRS